MNTWVDQMIAALELKQTELQRQVDGIKAAVEALRKGYDHPYVNIPEMFKPQIPEAPSVRITPEGPEQQVNGPDPEDLTHWPA